MNLEVDAQSIVGAAIAAVRGLAVRADMVDWAAVSDEFTAIAVRGDVGLALAALVFALGDPHTFVMGPDHAAQPAVVAARELRPIVEERDGVARLWLPGCVHQVDSPDAASYVRAAHRGIESLPQRRWSKAAHRPVGQERRESAEHRKHIPAGIRMRHEERLGAAARLTYLTGRAAPTRR